MFRKHQQIKVLVVASLLKKMLAAVALVTLALALVTLALVTLALVLLDLAMLATTNWQQLGDQMNSHI